jgi:acyl CoA:acetate/3-ketoacid CoA transferase alpha subunit
MEAERFKCQFYKQRTDGAKLYCICDFAEEARTGILPIVHSSRRKTLIFESYWEAKMFARSMNEGKIHFETAWEGQLRRVYVDAL